MLAIKVYGAEEVQLHSFFNYLLNWGEDSGHSPFISSKKKPRAHLNMRLGEA